MQENGYASDRKQEITDGNAPPITLIAPRQRKLYDPTVTLEEYHYYATRTRLEQQQLDGGVIQWRTLFSNKHQQNIDEIATADTKGLNLARAENRALVSDEEWTNASRAFRTASWGAVFYLITTDVLGPFATPYSIGALGYGPGIGIFTAFGILGAYSGYLIWRVFMAVDSHEFPARNYGDLAMRTWGTWARQTLNFLQALGLLLLLGQVTILFGQNISGMSKARLCYIVCPLIYTVCGFLLTQIRSLKNYGWIANFSFWLTIATLIISMVAIGINPPFYEISGLGSVGATVDPSSITPNDAGVYPPVQTYGGLPALGIVGSVTGLLSGVLAFAGLQLYVEFLAEMRRPHDFLKAMYTAQFVVYVIYLVYGCFVYHYQGQYTFNPSYLGVSSYALQTVGNALTLIVGLIAGGLYGNIGVKVLYNNVLTDIFGAPLITSKPGKIWYAALVPIWWSIGFVIAAAIPAYNYFVGIVSASTLLNLSYTIPPFLALGYDIQRNAFIGDAFDPATGVKRRAGESSLARLIRGFCSGGIFQVVINVWHLVYCLASLALCGLGLYASIQGMIDAFEKPQVNAFTCTSPLQIPSS